MKSYQEIHTSQVFTADGNDQVWSCRFNVQSWVAEFDRFAKNFEAVKSKILRPKKYLTANSFQRITSVESFLAGNVWIFNT